MHNEVFIIFNNKTGLWEINGKTYQSTGNQAQIGKEDFYHSYVKVKDDDLAYLEDIKKRQQFIDLFLDDVEMNGQIMDIRQSRDNPELTIITFKASKRTVLKAISLS